MSTTTRKHPASNGGKWCRNEKRLGIHIRDGLACAYCGSGIEDGVSLELDHVKPHSLGGSNCETNLVTACKKCNSSRGNRSVKDFSEAVANYTNDRTADEIIAHITKCIGTPIDRKEAKEILSRRISVRTACTQLSK